MLDVANTTVRVYISSNHNIVSAQGFPHVKKDRSFESRFAASRERLGPTELRVAQFLHDNREEVLVSSASALASRTSTSDATVIRTVKALGYSGMAGLRRELAS